jgi:hypothetical protein
MTSCSFPDRRERTVDDPGRHNHQTAESAPLSVSRLTESAEEIA